MPTVRSARSILIIDASPFGRSLGLLPAMKVLRVAYADSFVVGAASSGTCELLLDARLVDEPIDLGVIRDTVGESNVKRGFRLIKGARQFNIDLVLDFAPKPETQFLARLVLRARTVTPAKLPMVIELFAGSSSRSDRDDRGEHESVLRKLGLELSDQSIGVSPGEEENSKFEDLLSRNGFRGGEPVVVLYGNGSAKAWPIPSFAETAHRLANNFGARIVAVDEPSDRSFTEALAGLLPGTAITLSQPRALAVFAAIARASVFITDDQSLASAAEELGAPVIDVFAVSARGSATDDVYERACEILQGARSSTLFRR